DTNNIADAFLQAATQAPQPIQVAASKASSAMRLGTGILLASGTPPVFTLTYPPACWMRSKEVRSTAKSFNTGNAAARQGSMTIVCPSWNDRMCNWQVVMPYLGPCGRPLITNEHMPQIPSRQSWSK